MIKLLSRTLCVVSITTSFFVPSLSYSETCPMDKACVILKLGYQPTHDVPLTLTFPHTKSGATLVKKNDSILLVLNPPKASKDKKFTLQLGNVSLGNWSGHKCKAKGFTEFTFTEGQEPVTFTYLLGPNNYDVCLVCKPGEGFVQGTCG